ERMQTVAARPETEVPTSDLFRVMREAFNLYRRNFLLFLSILAVVQIPIALSSGAVFMASKQSSMFPALMLIVGFLSFILTPVTTGALLKAILDRYRGESASLGESYAFILDRGFRYILTSIFGGICQVIGAIFCGVGMLFTYPRAAFVSEVA